MRYRHVLYPGVQDIKAASVDLGAASLVWDVATTEGYFRHLFLALVEAFKPELPSLPFPIEVDMWQVRSPMMRSRADD